MGELLDWNILILAVTFALKLEVWSELISELLSYHDAKQSRANDKVQNVLCMSGAEFVMYIWYLFTKTLNIPLNSDATKLVYEVIKI